MRSAFYALINFINTSKVDDVYSNAAKMILENINKIPEYNITDVAEMCFVSTATISRLCRKLNYESFSDFKMDVTMNLRYFNHDSMRCLLYTSFCTTSYLVYRQIKQKEYRFFKLTAILTIAIPLILGFFAFIDFDRLFVMFHQLVFRCV